MNSFLHPAGPFLRRPRGLFVASAAAVALTLGYFAFAQAPATPTIDFDDGPLIAKNTPANVVLALSVEMPTSAFAYPEDWYMDRKLYQGYFNPQRCYTYPGYDGNTPATGAHVPGSHYFRPTGSTDANYYCNVAGAGTGFSGNYLNYATMSAPDIMRLALTGGHRGIDDPALTVLERGTVHRNYGYRRSLWTTLVPRLTPFAPGTTHVRANNCGDQVVFTTVARGCPGSGTGDLRPVAADQQPLVIKPRVLVCDSGEGPSRQVVVPDGGSYNFCTKYTHSGGTAYKPEGQVQRRSESIRLAAMSYLLEDARSGGVLRAPMKYTGPNAYDGNGTLRLNPEAEWSSTTGQFIAKPIADAVSGGYPYNGVINYLNRFGQDGEYKIYDPVGELWYESLRYLQGLQPTPQAVSGAITEAAKGYYPLYTRWTDPLTSACQRRNYILGIGDVNTHYSRSLPGITRAEQTALFNEGTPVQDFTYTASPTINGSAAALDAHTWTRIVDGFERQGAPAVAYTDAKGRSQSTGGKNPAPNGAVGNLDTTRTGAGGHDSYHWAGLAYWANTQPIRRDVLNGTSMDKVRVKTFMIDVDESRLSDANIRNTHFYLAAKYGYFDDREENGNPYTDATGAQWADGGFPKGHVRASQPDRLIAGVQRFFDEASRGGNALSNAALSSNSFAAWSPDAKRYNASFTAGRWTGAVRATDLRFNTATNTVTESPNAAWEAGRLLTEASSPGGTLTAAHVTPADRNIVTYLRGAAGSTPRAVTFTFAATANGNDLPASFGMVPYGSSSDGLVQQRIGYLRGERSGETSGLFRPRTSLLGDIINSGTAFKGGANPTLQGDGYPAFFQAKKNRTGVVYVGANDGLLHAFRASDGRELFAYLPGAVLEKAPLLTSKSYVHTHYVDAVPVVDEVKLAAGWRTVLVSGLGGGAQGVFALDVTDPNAFGTGSVLFEFTDRDDPQMGNVVGRPALVKMRTGSNPAAFKYFAVVASGYNNYQADGHAAPDNDQVLFFLDLGKDLATPWAEGTNYFKVELPAATAGAMNGLAQPGIRLGTQDEGLEFFAGDLQGRLWKIAFPDGLSQAKVALAVRKRGGQKVPMFTARSSPNVVQPITSTPVVYPYIKGGRMVIFGTGKYLEGADRANTSTQSIYGVWDSGQDNAVNYEMDRGDLNSLSFDTATRKIDGASVAYSLSTGAKRGWRFDLQQPKERIVQGGAVSTGVVSFSSTIPPASECSDNGRSEMHSLSPSTGFSAAPSIAFNGGYLSQSAVMGIALWGERAYGDRATSGRRTAVRKDVHSAQGGAAGGVNQDFRVQYLATGRVYWREVRDFNRVNP